MQRIEDRVEQARRTRSVRSSEFRSQLARGQSFKKKMESEGLAKDERYEIPLMQRIGHKVSN